MKKTGTRLLIVVMILAMLLSSCGKKEGPMGPEGEDGAPGKSAYELAVAEGFVGTLEEWLLSLVGEKGEIGAEVTSIEKTATAGLVDTYTITFSNGTTQSFTVQNGEVGATGAQGVGIADIKLTASDRSSSRPHPCRLSDRQKSPSDETRQRAS